MQNTRWLSFAVSSAISRTVVHFIPSAHATAAPYPVSFHLRVFSKEFGSKSVNLEGGRLGQPDGVRLEDVFPVLAEGISVPYGVEIQISTPQPRVDISSSCCIIELASAAQSIRFLASTVKVRENKEKSANSASSAQSAPLIAVQDAMMTTSMILVNTGDNSFQPTLLTPRPDSAEYEEVMLETVAGQSAAELFFKENLFSDMQPAEFSWGLLRGRAFEFYKPLPSSVLAYAVYRDTLTKRIVSVSPL